MEQMAGSGQLKGFAGWIYNLKDTKCRMDISIGKKVIFSIHISKKSKL